MCCAKEKYSGNSRFSLSGSAKLDGKKYQLNVHEVRVKCLHNYQFTFNKSNAAEIWNPNSESTDSLAITSNKQNHLSLSVNARLRSGVLSREAQFSHYLWVPRWSRPIWNFALRAGKRRVFASTASSIAAIWMCSSHYRPRCRCGMQAETLVLLLDKNRLSQLAIFASQWGPHCPIVVLRESSWVIWPCEKILAPSLLY